MSRSAPWQNDPVNSRLLRADLFGTLVFVIALAVAVPFKSHRWAQVVIVVVSLALFAVGVATSLWAYANALERSIEQLVDTGKLNLLEQLRGSTTSRNAGSSFTSCWVNPAGGRTFGVVNTGFCRN